MAHAHTNEYKNIIMHLQQRCISDLPFIVVVTLTTVCYINIVDLSILYYLRQPVYYTQMIGNSKLCSTEKQYKTSFKLLDLIKVKFNAPVKGEIISHRGEKKSTRG